MSNYFESEAKERTRRAKVGGILLIVFVIVGFALGSFYQKSSDYQACLSSSEVQK